MPSSWMSGSLKRSLKYAFPPSCLPRVIELEDAGRDWEWKAPRPPASLPPVIVLRDKPKKRQRTELQKQCRRDRERLARAAAKTADDAIDIRATHKNFTGRQLVKEGDSQSAAASSGGAASSSSHQMGHCDASTLAAAAFTSSDKK